MKIPKIIIGFFLTAFFIGCIYLIASVYLFRSIDCDKTEVFNLTGNFRLSYWCEKKNMALYYNTEEEYGGLLIVDKTIIQAEWDENWIIAKQNSNLEDIKQANIHTFKELKTAANDINDINKSNNWASNTNYFINDKSGIYHIIKVSQKGKPIFYAKSNERLNQLRDSLGIPTKLEKQLVFE